ncbi:DUF6362 family protein [Jhaorihella thermophila]|uniref:DUF6362 domain-containing protein n=1 Tax=Jhaorihella thermophila TaxID=488547 RepID=A0A1H5ZCF2_9RHOB|nr:DUF6362 family protein [Jhaorihella thermophila]SEG33317.1 hypothetical protein SAMN05421751_13311 [Jhaorihella thermophila]
MARRRPAGRGGLSPSEIADRLEEAARTLRRLPDPPGSGPRGYGRSWPEYIHEAKDAYGWHEARLRVRPSPADIQQMEECFDWLRLVPVEEAQILWWRAEGLRWREVAIRAGCVRQTAWRRWVAALATIAKKLEARG